MPELPDVEAHRRFVDEHAAGRQVTGVSVADPELLEGTTAQGLGSSLVGRRLERPRRHGKWLILPFDGDDGPRLVVHFRMTGDLSWDGETSDDTSGSTDPGVQLVFGDHELTYRSRRRLGAVTYVREEAAVSDVTGPLGPDALELDEDGLHTALEGRRGGIKSALMDQELIAGLGNELVDEILWRAGVRPRDAVADLDLDVRREDGEGGIERLYRTMREVLTDAVRAGHVPRGPTWLNGQRDRDDPRCPRDGTPLERDDVAGRTTYWCPTHQSAA